MESNKKVLTVEEVAKELRISRSLAYRQIRKGNIYALKFGDRYLIPVKALEQLLAGNYKEKGDERGGGGISNSPL